MIERVHAISSSKVGDVFRVEYQPISTRPPAIIGWIYFVVFKPHLNNFPICANLRSSRNTHNLIIDSDFIEFGHYTPKNGIIVLYWQWEPNFHRHWLSVSGYELKVCWIEEGF